MINIKLKDLSRRLKMELDLSKNGPTFRGIQSWADREGPYLKKEVIDSMSKGLSPVKGGGGQSGGKSRYQEYSDLYKEQIKKQKGKFKDHGKRIRPVNLKLTGGLHESVRSRAIKFGVVIWFESELAKYHDKLGAGKSKVIRKMLPSESGQEFSRVIHKGILERLKQAILESIKKGK